MRREKLTKKQLQIYSYIKQAIEAKGYPPSIREIAKAVNLKSSSSVGFHLSKIEELGYIKRDPDRPRGIKIVDDCFDLEQKEIVNVPVLRTVSAGQSLYATQNIEEYLPIPIELINRKESFLIKVNGNGMINANIFDGDRIIVNEESVAENGDIIVALIGDSVTVTRFFKENDYYRLQPENDSMEPIIVDHIEILGKVIGVFRLGIH